MDVADELIGRTFGGRYDIERALRRGGMGAVYEAKDRQTGTQVAIKVVRPALLEEAGAVARFKREMRLATEIEHENVVRSFDCGDDNGFLWIAMELLVGVSLRERLDSSGRMSWQETLPLMTQVVAALGAAHARSVSHRDLKPENIMLVEKNGQRVAKLVDFGIAKQAKIDGEGESTHMTGTGFIIGTPGYVAPELVLDGVTDDLRSDFYALGVTWFEMLTGAPPFTAKTPLALTLRHAHEPAPTPSSLLPFAPVPAPIEKLLMALLEKKPEQRPQSTAEVTAQLERIAVAAQHPSTPMPSLPTMTDATPHGTNVVPFVRTPPPSPAPPASTPMVGTAVATPLAMAPATTSTPSPPLAEQSLPRAWIIGGAAAAIAAVCTTIALSVWATRSDDRPRDPPLAAVVAPTPAEVVVVPVAPVPVVPAPVVLAVGTPVADAGVVAAVAQRTPPVPVDDRRRGRPPPPAVVAVPTVAAAVVAGTVIVRPRPKAAAWKVSVDDGFALETPKKFDLPAGPHRLRLSSTTLGVDVTRTITIVAGGNAVFDEDLSPRAAE